MSDIDDYGDDGDLDWLYVEDVYDEADELAEHACPSPPFDPAADPYDYDDDYDPYHYFEDLTYLSDSYFDSEKPSTKHSTAAAKRSASDDHTATRRKRVKSHQHESGEEQGPVRWRSRKTETLDSTAHSISHAELVALPRVALFKDWEQLLNKTPGIGEPQPVDQTEDTLQDDADADDEGEDEAEAEADGQGVDKPPSEPASNAIDLADLSAVASLLSEENMSQLRAAMQAKGLDPEAVEVVLADLLAGRDPDLEDGEDDADDDHVANGQTRNNGSKSPAPSRPRQPPLPKSSETKAEPSQEPAQPKRSNKRKHTADDEAADTKMPARGKRARNVAAAEPDPSAEPPATLTKTTRSGRKRK